MSFNCLPWQLIDEFEGCHAKQATTKMFCTTSETYPTNSSKLPQKHFNYHDELETTTGRTGHESLTSKYSDVFLCRNVY